MADHILKMAGLWIFCDFVSLKNIDKIKLPRGCMLQAF